VHVWGVDVWVRGILASLADGGESLGDLVMCSDKRVGGRGYTHMGNGFRQRIAKALSCNVHPKGGGRTFITQHQINIVHCSRYQEQVNVKYWNNYSWVSPSMYLTSVRVST